MYVKKLIPVTLCDYGLKTSAKKKDQKYNIVEFLEQVFFEISMASV